MWIGLAIGAWVLVGASVLGWVSARLHLYLSYAVPAEQPPELDVYAYAFLCGGRRRTAQTALTALHRTGRLTTAGSRVLRTTKTAPPPAHPVEASALAACPPGRRVKGLRAERRTKRSAPVRRIADDLARRGLLVHPRLLVRLDNWNAALIITVSSSAIFGCVASIAWDERHSGPAGRAALIVAPTLLGLALPALAGKLPTALTPAGERALAAHRDRPPDGHLAKALRQVATEGVTTTAMPAGLRSALRRMPPSDYQPGDPAGLGGL
ncbi:TIGR04222 domain-containing membrane protein [Streptomyces sp. NPDC089919]|uniref:TIGR04222 domain-containing membrane protein n=1 Tax=Streptomyces sp. NPDC089919 TaxID=3155188 RepID=UPI00342C6404